MNVVCMCFLHWISQNMYGCVREDATKGMLRWRLETADHKHKAQIWIDDWVWRSYVVPERKLPRAENGDQRGGLDVAHAENIMRTITMEWLL